MKPEWQGTEQHRDASDLSRWLVHLTRSEEDLISILMSGRIEARSPYGAGKYFRSVQQQHHSVCLTEIPLPDLRRMTLRRPWGIVFDKERLRTKFGAQQVWYVDDPSQQWSALEDAMDAARNDPRAPIWTLTPFVESVRSRSSPRPNDWRWEREWRVQGDLEFGLEDVAMIVADQQGAPEFFDQISVGMPWISHDDSVIRWSGGFTRGWEREVEGMLERFGALFASPDSAGMSWDGEDRVYVAYVPLLETSEAMDEAFGYLVPELQEVVERALDDRSSQWCRVYDLEHAGD